MPARNTGGFRASSMFSNAWNVGADLTALEQSKEQSRQLAWRQLAGRGGTRSAAVG
jgi:hypothetical protein